MKWEPIATAPKDRELLLCLDGKSVMIGRWAKTFDGDMWVNDAGPETIQFWLEPTHWMPLPALPKETWKWHEPTSESGDLEFWVSSFGKVTMDRPEGFGIVSCSQCGQSFGPGIGGWSHCEDHLRQPSEGDRLVREDGSDDAFIIAHGKLMEEMLAEDALASESQREAAGKADEKPDGQAENVKSAATGSERKDHE